MSGRNQVVKAGREYAFRTQARDLGRGLKVSGQILEDIDPQSVTGDADPLNAGPVPR